MTVSRRAVLAATGRKCACADRRAQAQTYPNRTIRIVVPFPAGGPTDILSRVIAQKMSEDWGQPVVVENRPGADTAIGAVQVAKAAPDGYTLLAAMDTTLVMNPATKTNLPYDPFKDFAAVTLAAKNTSLLMVRAEDGPKTIPELIARAQGVRQDELRRRHHHHAARRLHVQPRRRHQGAAHPLQGQRRGGAGPAHRRGRLHHRRRRFEPAADQGRKIPRARQAQQPAAAGAARRAAAVGGRRHAGARRHVELDCAGGAGRHAARRGRRAQGKVAAHLRRPRDLRQARSRPASIRCRRRRRNSTPSSARKRCAGPRRSRTAGSSWITAERRTCCASSCWHFCSCHVSAFAQPAQKSIRIIVPFAPGASADGIARAISIDLGKRSGKTVVVENMTGAGGSAGPGDAREIAARRRHARRRRHRRAADQSQPAGLERARPAARPCRRSPS